MPSMKNGETAYIWKSSPQKWELIPDEYKTFVEMDAIQWWQETPVKTPINFVI